jgi:hypothetical protein
VQGTAVAFDYMQWLQNERGVNVRTIGLVIRSIMSAAKFLYHDVSKVKASLKMVTQPVIPDHGAFGQSMQRLCACHVNRAFAAGAAW